MSAESGFIAAAKDRPRNYTSAATAILTAYRALRIQTLIKDCVSVNPNLSINQKNYSIALSADAFVDIFPRCENGSAINFRYTHLLDLVMYYFTVL